MYDDEQKLIQKNIELRNLAESVKNGSINAGEAQKRLDTLKIEKRELEQQIAQRNAPMDGNRGFSSLADVKNAMLEKRSVTLQGTGAISQIRELQKELSQKKEILNLVKYFYGPNAATMIPILSPGLASPVQAAEGANGIDVDTIAALGAKELKAHAFMSILPVSAETINLGSVNLDTELPLIFAEAFADCFARQVLTGDGTGMNFDGIFNNLENTIDCNSTGNPKIADLVNLAVKISDFDDDAVIILHPSVYAGILADDTPGVSIFYKELLIKEKTIEGVKILTTGYAPSSVSSGSTVAIAGKMDNYALAIASQILIEPIKRVGDSNTYFTATLFANGCKIINKNFIGLMVK